MTPRTYWRIPTTIAVVVGICSSLLVVAAVAVGVAVSTYRAQDFYVTHSAIRSPELFPDEPVTVRAVALYPWVDGRSVNTIAAEPITEDAAVPFGLEQWPAPGEFLVSADLSEHVDELSARFGRFVGFLPSHDLPSASSRTLFARPLVPMNESWSATGFGVSGPYAEVAASYSGMFNDERFSRPVSISVILLLLVIPAMVLLNAALTVALRPSDRIRRTLEVLGVRPRTLWRMSLLSLAKPVGIGLLSAVTVIIALFLIDVPLPWATFTIRSIDVRRSAGVIAVAVVVGAALVASVLAVRSYPRALGRGVRPRPAGPTWRRTAWAVTGVVSVLVASQVSVSLGSRPDDLSAMVSQVAILLGMLLALTTIRAVVGEILDRVGAMFARRGRRRQRPVQLLAGRSVVSSPPAVRVASTAGAMLVILGFAATWALVGQRPAIEAQQLMREIAGRYYTVSPPSAAADPGQVLAALPPGEDILGFLSLEVVTADGVESVTGIRGSETALESWELTPGDEPVVDLPRLLALALGDGGETVPITLGAPATMAELDALGAQGQEFFVFRHDGRSLDRLATQRALSSVGGLGWNVSNGGEQWLIGANNTAFQMRWLWWYGAVAAILLVAAAVTTTFSDLTQQTRRIAPVDTLFARSCVGGRVMAVRTAVVCSVGLLVGGGEAAALARLSSGGRVTTTSAFTVVAALVAVVALALFALYAPLLARAARTTQNWDPHEDEWTDEES